MVEKSAQTGEVVPLLMLGLLKELLIRATVETP